MCPIIRRNVAFAVVVAALQLLRSNVVLADTSAPIAAEKAEEQAPARPYTIEVKPLSMGVASLLGGSGLGLGAESMLSDQWALTATVQGVNYDMSDKTRQKLRDKKGDSYSIPTRGDGFGANVGARWYATPEGDSWYAGAGLGGNRETARWERGDQALDARVTTYGVTGEGGYRWTADTGFMVRLGAGLLVGARNRSLSTVHDAGASMDDFERSAEKKYPTNRVALQPIFDAGLGYRF
jgi:hypothetical protein